MIGLDENKITLNLTNILEEKIATNKDNIIQEGTEDITVVGTMILTIIRIQVII
jgi:hypothetical protein